MKREPSIPSTIKAVTAIAITIGTLALSTSCSSHRPGGTITVAQTSGFQPNYGPFDSNGNYIDAWADNPPRRRYVAADGKVTSPPPPPVYSPPPKQTKTYSKPKPKPKASTRSHLVKRGDTLYGLSRKYGVSVSSIQRANKLRNTTIRIGQRLVIPR